MVYCCLSAVKSQKPFRPQGVVIVMQASGNHVCFGCIAGLLTLVGVSWYNKKQWIKETERQKECVNVEGSVG